MEISANRTIEPEYTIKGSYDFTDADLAAAFGSLPTAEGQDLFYNVFGPTFRTKPPEEKWALLARIAALVANPVDLPATAARFSLPPTGTPKKPR